MNTQTLERPTIRTATITVQFVNEPKGRARSGSIKDIDGIYFWVKPDMLAEFQPGEQHDIEYTETVSEGFTNRTIKAHRLVLQEQRPASAPQRQAPLSTDPTNYPSRNAPPRAQAQTRSDPVQRSAPVDPPPPQRQPQNGNGNGYYRPTSPKDARRMFICSQMNALITSHQVRPNTDDIAAAIAMLSDAYDMTLGQEDQS